VGRVLGKKLDARNWRQEARDKKQNKEIRSKMLEEVASSKTKVSRRWKVERVLGKKLDARNWRQEARDKKRVRQEPRTKNKEQRC
jgi:hypothetical protein